MDDEHKVTPKMTAKIAFAGQMAPSFEAAEQGFEYLMGLQISRTLIRQITEETGQKVYDQQMERAEETIKRPEDAIPSLLPHERRAGTLYMLIYNDKNVITRKSGQSVLVSKEYVAYWGEVNGFKNV
ncbi:MAG: hypothetical protein Q7J85_01535 [Bacillota bacterium]|nr:hypothetical protein [Bacillota bacterium]